MAEWLNLDTRKNNCMKHINQVTPNLYLAADRNINPGLTRWQASVNKNNVGLLLPWQTSKFTTTLNFFSVFVLFFEEKIITLLTHLNCNYPLFNLRKTYQLFYKDGPEKMIIYSVVVNMLGIPSYLVCSVIGVIYIYIYLYIMFA